MKKVLALLTVLCLLLAGCGNAAPNNAATSSTAPMQSSEADAPAAEPAATVQPLPDTTMENLTDAILAVSLEEGGAYVDDAGILQMDVKIYTYDKYDMVDISLLQVGDILVTHSGEVEVLSLERSESGTVFINGGLDAGGFDLVTNDGGIYFETGYNDAKNWYEVGAETLRVSVDFVGRDNADPDRGELLFYPGSFLNGEVSDYNFTPHNTTVRTEGGQVVEMDRVFLP